MQRATTAYEASLAQILRRAERRHHVFEFMDAPFRATERSKLETFRQEEMDWELCLRRYMDHMESWSNPPTDPESQLTQSGSRVSVASQRSLVNQDLQRRNSNSSIRSGYGDYRLSGELDTSIYYRPPRRNSMHERIVLSQPGLQRTNSTGSMHSDSSGALVLYNSQPQPAASNSSAIGRPVRRASISRDFHWEYVGRSSTFGMLAPLAAQYPELKDAQADIFSQTQGMSSTEARAYAQGRLANLPPQVTDEVKNILSLQHQGSDLERGRAALQDQPVPPPSSLQRRSLASDSLQRRSLASDSLQRRSQSSTMLQRMSHPSTSLQRASQSSVSLQRMTPPPTLTQRVSQSSASLQRSSPTPPSMQRRVPSFKSLKRTSQASTSLRSSSAENRRRSSSLDSVRKRVAQQQLKQSAHQRQSMASLEAARRENRPKSLPPTQRSTKPKSKKSKTMRVKDLRPLTAISEKSTFSWPRGSMDKPQGSRSIMQVFNSRKTSLTSEDVPPSVPESSVPDIPSSVPEEREKPPTPESTISSSSRRSPASPDSSKKSSTDSEDKGREPQLKSRKSTPSLFSHKSLDKPLPPNPKAPSSNGNQSKFNKAALLAMFKPKNKDIPSAPSSTRIPTSASKESLRRVSMDLLKRKDSKMTLFSVAEGVEVPLEMSLWLRALPYIEGRATSPRPPMHPERSVS
jgi:hypothetical protein